MAFADSSETKAVGISFPSYRFSSSFTWKRFNLFPREAGASLRSPTLFSVLLFLSLILSRTYTHKSPLIVKDIFFANMFLRHSLSCHLSIIVFPLGLKSGPTSSQPEITLLLFLSRYYKPSLFFLRSFS